jgi:putative heme transporter
MRRVHAHPQGADGETEFVEIDTTELSGIFTAPSWLRDLGIMSWLLVGIAGMLVGAVWLLSLTQTIVIPVVTAAILASVLSPLVAWLRRHRIPRGAGTAIVLLAIVLAGVLLAWLVIRGISAQSGDLNSELQGAATKIEGWLKDLGVNSQTAAEAKQDASSSISSAFHFLLNGLGTGLKELAGLAVFLSFTVLSLFFLLKDGPGIRRWLERHVGLPQPVARTISGRTIGSMRGYFVGVTAVAAFNGIVIGLGALVLGVPLAGSIAVINFVAAYIPYIGAWTAGAFTVLVALGDGGPSTALAMGVITLLANGMLQQLIQPIAYGAALGIHPLAVLIVTIAGGALFGTIGLIVAAPLTAAATKIAADLGRARAEAPAPAAPT